VLIYRFVVNLYLIYRLVPRRRSSSEVRTEEEKEVFL
jgi:hypothetical protein